MGNFSRVATFDPASFSIHLLRVLVNRSKHWDALFPNRCILLLRMVPVAMQERHRSLSPCEISLGSLGASKAAAADPETLTALLSQALSLQVIWSHA